MIENKVYDSMKNSSVSAQGFSVQKQGEQRTEIADRICALYP